MKIFFVILCLLLTPAFSASKSPLVMKHADSLAVSRRVGTLLLHGRVHFVHDSVEFRTQHATWNKNAEKVECRGGFLFTHPSGYIHAKSGVYQKKQGIATATGSVKAGDSLNTYLFLGDHLIYDREHEILTLPQNPRIFHYNKKEDGTTDTVTVVAEHILYNRSDEIASAQRNALLTVKETSSDGKVDTVSIKGESVIYNKKKEYAEAETNVLLTIKKTKENFQKDTLTLQAKKVTYDKSIEFAEAKEDAILTLKEAKNDGKIDTITLKAKNLTYNRELDFAEAFENVVMTQREMTVTCDTGYFDRKNSWLSMKGNPTCDLKSYKLTGDSIFLVLDSTGKMLKSALVIRNAHGVQQEEAKRNSPGSVTEAFGDTLYAEFSGGKISRLYVNLNAKGFFYELDLPDYRNLMDGNRLDFFFNEGKMDYAVVSGNAQSTYFYVKNNRTVAGKNEAAGDTINIFFDPKKNAVKSLKMKGGTTPASGRYIDLEKEARLKAEKDSTQNESVKKMGDILKNPAKKEMIKE